MSEVQFQWVTPVGGVTPPMSLSESSEFIQNGKVFPTQFVSLNGQTPQHALNQPDLQEIWRSILPEHVTFSKHAGMVNTLVLGRVFSEISINRLTGRLFARHNESMLYFMLRFTSGQLVEICSSDTSTYLGQLLLQRSLLTPDQLARAIELAKTDAELLGKACVNLDYITEKQLNLLLAEQMFIRVRKIARFPHIDIRFCEGGHTSYALPTARISGYSLLEITLGYGLPDHQIKSYMSDLMNRPVVINRQSPALRMVSAEDRDVLKGIHTRQDFSPLSERREWTQRDGALKAISWDLMGLFTVPEHFKLVQEYAHLSGDSPLEYLGVQRFVDAGEIHKTLQGYRERIGLDTPASTPEEERVKRALKVRLRQVAELAQGSERDRRVYQRMQAMGADLSNDQLRGSLFFDICMQEGEAALKRQRYEEAQSAYADALRVQPQDIRAQIKEAWSLFLGSERGDDVFEQIKKRFQGMIDRAPQATLPRLFLARLQRLHGQVSEAEATLRALLEASPDHAEAQAELRLLFNREYDQKKNKLKVFRQANSEAGLYKAAGALVAVALLTISFWGAAHLIPSSRLSWPEKKEVNLTQVQISLNPQLTFNQIMRTNYERNYLISTAYMTGLSVHKRAEVTSQLEGEPTQYSFPPDVEMNELNRALAHLYTRFHNNPEQTSELLRDSQTIPHAQRVFGNVEHYWLSDDSLGWARRITLLLIGLIGLLRLRPLKKLSLSVNSWSIIALIYGSVVGMLSPIATSPTALGSLLGMKVIHSFSEVLFFHAFLGLTLLRSFQWSPWIPTILVSASLALFKISLSSVWYLSSISILIVIAQAGIFIGGACLLLMWQSKSLLPPLLAHLALTLIPVLRSVG